MDTFLLSLYGIFNLYTFLILSIGVFLGILIGSIPGFTITMGVALALPFSYGMEPMNGLALMIGVQVGGCSGGLISACLLGIPGTPSSIATTFDAYPMAQKGEAAKALSLGLWSSFIGTIISGLVLVISAPILAEWALRFGPWEMFSVMLFGMTAIVGLSQGAILKGLISGLLGITFSLVGMDPLLGVQRLTFGVDDLAGGFNFLPILIGMFAFSQVFEYINHPKTNHSETLSRRFNYTFRKLFYDLWFSKLNLIRSALIGVFVGILPGAGGSIANLFSYDIAKRTIGHKVAFGTGIKEGVIAAETANNASVGGAYVPTLALGIPGNAITALMLGALVIHGIQPGPFLMNNHPVLVYGIFISIFVAAFLMLIFQTIGIRFFIKINKIPQHYLIPIVFLLCVLGSYAINNRLFDVVVLFVFGLIGYWMKRHHFALTPFILGIILGPLIESNLRKALSINPDLSLFIMRPISGVMLLFVVISIGISLYSSFKTIAKNKDMF